MHFRDGFEPGRGLVGLWQGSCDSYSLAQLSREGSHGASLAPCADRGGLEIHRRQDTSLERQTGVSSVLDKPTSQSFWTLPPSWPLFFHHCLQVEKPSKRNGCSLSVTAGPDCLQALNISGTAVSSEELAPWSTNAPLSRKHRLAPASLTNAEFRRH